MGRDGKPTRDRILEESKKLIYENGFAGTTIDLILERAGITKGAFFYHFKSKDEMARVLVNEFAQEDLKLLDEIIEETREFADRPLERLLGFVQRFIDMFSGLEEPPSCLYASVSNEQNQYDPEIRQVIYDTMLRWRKAFEELIRPVLQEYRHPVEIDLPALSDQFNVILEGSFILSKAYKDPSVSGRQLALYKQYLELLFAEPTIRH